MTRTKAKGIAAALALLLMTLLLALPAATLADDVKQGSTVSGTVRVYLSSIGSKTSVDFTVDGSYSISGDTSRAIARGTRITVKNSGGTLMMTMGGQTQTMGSRFKLRRHQTSGNNGVRIAQARYPANLYPGDIECIAKGGNVQIVVHVYMEDYMQGVLPYELDNSFPLEALKAQAVAARTYALKKMSAQAATYDLVDTTSDQVYNGTPAGNARCVQAVQETSGIVGTVGGDYMASYYTASNGGQTESVANAWGSGSYSYLQIKDDPYDLRNGASIAKSVTFYKNGSTSVPALTQLLRDEAAAQTGMGSVTIQSIDSVSVHTPKYAEPSRVYTKVTVGLTLSGYGRANVTLDYFNQVESLCSMSINVLKNETLTVTDTGSAFKLTARRFGHGVGMSQRGAQQMASEGFAYDEILSFYYPGITRTRYTMTRTLLPSMDGTPGTPDEPVSDAKAAVVVLSNPLDSLNLRREANTSSAILAQMPHGTQVTLLEFGTAWSRVQYGTLSGYVKNEYLSVEGDGVEETPSIGHGKGSAVVALSDESQTLNLRAAPTTGSAVVARLRHGTVLAVLERYESWTYVAHGALNGYVMNDYIVYDAADDEPETAPTPAPPQQGETLTATVALQSSDSRLNVRAEKNLGAAVLLRLTPGTQVTVTAWGEAWCAVSYGGVSGYCATDYLRFDQNEGEGAPEVPSVHSAIVLPKEGLNLRTAASLSSSVIMTLPQGAALTITGEERGGMLPVRLGSIAGFVATEYVYIVKQELVSEATPAPIPTAQPVLGTAQVTAGSGLVLRSGPSTAHGALTTMPYGASVSILGREEGGFFPVRYGETEGYASATYLKQNQQVTPIPIPAATPTPVPMQPTQGANRPAVVTAPSGLNLRAQPHASAQLIATLGYGVEVVVTGEWVNGFYPVQVGTLYGYVSADYIRIGGGQVPQAAPVVTEEPVAPPVQPESGYRVVVDSDNGLNLRAQPNGSSQVVYVLPYGMVLTVLGESENGFLHVQWANYEGYVAGAYVTPFGTQPGQ